MATALSMDLRLRVLAAIDGGVSCRQAARRFGVSAASAIRWQALRRRQGDARPQQQGGDRRSHRIEEHAQTILAVLAAKRDITLVEMKAALAKKGLSFGVTTLWRFFARHRIRLKKTAHALEQDRPDVLIRRQTWFDAQIDFAPDRLIFIDETWASTAMTRKRGRAVIGERLRMGVPQGHWKTTTFVAGLRCNGLIAPFVLDGPINREAFEVYVERVLVPELRPGDVVMMDNLSSHKGPKVQELINAANANLLYLPPYSPDFNPIEQVFAKLKALLRTAEERTIEGLWRLIGSLLKRFSPDECQNYFTAAGYALDTWLAGAA